VLGSMGMGDGVGDVHLRRALGLHEFDGESEQAARLVADHLEVVGFAGARQAVAPVQVHALAAVQVQQLLGEDVDELGVVHAQQVLERFEVDVVGRVDGLGRAEDGVCDGDAAAQDGRVFDVVDAVGVSGNVNLGGWAVRRTVMRQCAACRRRL
jgi:hypothetical protein